MRAHAGTVTVWRRVAAFGLDYVLVAVYIAALSVAAHAAWVGSIGRVPGPDDADPWMFDLLAFTTLVLPVTLYFALSESSARAATFGKRRLGLTVVWATGSPLALRQSLLRSALKFLPWQLAHSSLFHIPGWPAAVDRMPPVAAAGLALSCALVLLTLLDLLVTGGRCTPYDRVARTQVQRIHPPRG